MRTESENDEEGKEERKTRQQHNNKSKREIGCSANIHNSKFMKATRETQMGFYGNGLREPNREGK